jgi:hypothetical protein
MPVSDAKLAANRRNAQKSTGPRTDEGKGVSKLNAVTHGLRAETVVLLDEDPQALEERRGAWRACLLPGDDVEQRLVDNAVVHTWQQDRARRAQASRINANITLYGVDQGQTNEKDVDDLGRRLFKDRYGPLVLYPTVSLLGRDTFNRTSSTSYVEKGGDDPDQPSTLVLSLQSTLPGCEWMIGEWAKLKAILDEGQAWVSSDKLKAVRLLGKQPFDAIDERDVAMVFLASFVLNADKGSSWYWEISIELSEKDVKRFEKSAAVRELESLKPQDAAKARQALSALIERATVRLTAKADAHRERARVMAALAPDFLAFDDSPDGERLRRFELASGRGLSRSLDDLRKHRRSVVSSPSSVASGPLSKVGCKAEAVPEAIVTNEPTDAQENSPNEPTAAAEKVTNEPTEAQINAPNEPSAGAENVRNEATVAAENAPNEPTEAQINAPNEPTVAQINAPNEPTVAQINAPNEPTEAQINAPNEPTVAQISVTDEPTAALVSVTNEPTAARENVTNEPTGALVSAPNEPTAARENVPNEPTAAYENVPNEPATTLVSVPNEPTVAQTSVTNEPTVAEISVTNEPTAAYEYVTNEPNLVANSVRVPSEAPSAGTKHRDDEGLQAEVDPEKGGESYQQGVERRKAAREDRTRRLNEEARREAADAMAAHRARRHEQRSKNCKPGVHPKARAAQEVGSFE